MAADTLHVKTDKSFPGIVIRDLVPDRDGRLLAAADVQLPCEQRTNAAVVEFSANWRMGVRYIDNGPLESHGRVLLVKPNGRLILVGQSVRPYDVEVYERQDFSDPNYVASLEQRERKAGRYKNQDAFLVEIDNAGLAKEPIWLQTGSSVFIETAALQGDSVILAGAIDWQVMWLRVDFEPGSD